MAKQPKSLNKILATSAGAAVVAGALAPAAVSAAAADDFTDVSEDTRHYDADRRSLQPWYRQRFR